MCNKITSFVFIKLFQLFLVLTDLHLGHSVSLTHKQMIYLFITYQLFLVLNH